jgi:hypothetical protein
MDIEPIRLDPFAPTLDCNTRRVYDHVCDSMSLQKSMQPKAIASGLIATDHQCLGWQVEALPSSIKFVEDRLAIASRDGTLSWLLSNACGKT